MVKVGTIIVNYCTFELVIECLRSLFENGQAHSNVPVIVVDNASPDNSADKLEAAIRKFAWQSWCQLLRNNENAGFSAGCNSGIQAALAQNPNLRFVLLLNPDTIVRPHAVSALAEYLDAHSDVGIVGSRLESLDGAVQRSAFRFPSILGELENGLRLGIITKLLHRFVVAPPSKNVAHQTDWVSGASMMIRREVIDEIGLLDEGYFLYFEEVDYCRRAGNAGWTCWYVPNSHVVHLVGQSTAANGKRMPRCWFESRRRYFRKHYGWLRSSIADIVWLVSYSLWRVRRWIQRKPDADPPRLLTDFARFSLGWPSREGWHA